MKKKFAVWTVIVATALAGIAQEEAPAAVEPAPPPPSPAEKLYQRALMEQESGEPKLAIRTASSIVALHSMDEEVMPKTELLCAELYVELNLLDVADVTARQVVALYEGTDVAEKAAALREKIEQLKADKESEGRTQ